MQKNYNNKTFSAKMVPTKLNSYHKNLYFDIKTYYGTKKLYPPSIQPQPPPHYKSIQGWKLKLEKKTTLGRPRELIFDYAKRFLTGMFKLLNQADITYTSDVFDPGPFLRMFYFLL